MIITRDEVDEDKAMDEMYFQFAKNVCAVSFGTLYTTKQQWHMIIDIDNIIQVSKFREKLFDILMPINQVADKYGVSYEEYMKLYCQNKEVMNIPKRKEVLTLILNGELDKIEIR